MDSESSKGYSRDLASKTMKKFRGELARFSQVKILYLITCYRASVFILQFMDIKIR